MDSEIQRQKIENGKPIVKNVVSTVNTTSSAPTSSVAGAGTGITAVSAPPRMTRALFALLCMTTLAAKIPSIGKALVNNFALLPMATVGQSKLWNVVTGGFLDTNIFSGAVNIALFFTMGRWVETSWGARPFLLYILLINTLSAIVTYICMLGAFVITRIDTYFFTAVGTTNGICIGLLVAIKQMIPDHVIGSSSVHITANYLPLIYMALTIVLTSVQFFRAGVLVFTLAAFQFSWTYLRFFRFNSNEGVYGDLSDTFAYQTLFPLPVRPPIVIIANIMFLIFKPLLMAPQASPQQPQQQQQENGDEIKFLQKQSTSKASTIDTERRRQRALKVLDERIQAAAAADKAAVSDIEATSSGSKTGTGTDSIV